GQVAIQFTDLQRLCESDTCRLQGREGCRPLGATPRLQAADDDDRPCLHGLHSSTRRCCSHLAARVFAHRHLPRTKSSMRRIVAHSAIGQPLAPPHMSSRVPARLTSSYFVKARSIVWIPRRSTRWST